MLKITPPSIFLINLVPIAVFQYQLSEYTGRNARRILSGAHGESVVDGVGGKIFPALEKCPITTFFLYDPLGYVRLGYVRMAILAK